MEFISGVKKKETFEISELFELEEGTSVKGKWCHSYHS
jgi:hypothetical protein